MKPTISTTALVATLVGTGMLVFNALGLSISLQELAPAKGLAVDLPLFGIHGTILQAWYVDLWTVPQREWMTIGCVLIAGGRLLDARFPRV